MADIVMFQEPQEKYESREKLEKEVKDNALRSGFAVVVLKSDKHYITLGCSKHPRQAKRVKTTTSNPIADEGTKRLKSIQVGACAWMLKGILRRDGFWYIIKKNLEHNHDLPVAGLHQNRRLNVAELAKVHTLTKVGLAPRHIQSVLMQENPSTKAVIRDIYNARFLMKGEYLNGGTSISVLMEELQSNDWVFDFVKDEKHRLSHLFFAYKEAVNYTTTCHNVFLMDCTYKTNKFQLPLFNIVGVSPHFTTFNVAFCFMRGEQEEDYTWALDKLKRMINNAPIKAIITDRDLALGERYL
jgi:hypothetical protein